MTGAASADADVPGSGAPGPGPGWFADPLGPPGTLRWWGGAAWSSRTVLDGGAGETVSWRPELTALPAPDDGPSTEAPVVEARPISFHPIAPEPPEPSVAEAPAPETPVVEAPAAEPAAAEPAATTTTAVGLPDADLPAIEPVAFDAVEVVPPELPPVQAPSADLDPLRAAFGDDADWRDDDTVAPTSRRRRRLVPALAAIAVLAIAAGAGAGVLDQTGRPEVEPALAYRDADAGFSLRYPDGWTVERETPGESVQFAIAAPGAAKTQINLVTVAVGAEPAPGDDTGLPSLDELSEKVTTGLREQFPAIALVSAVRTELANAPAYRLEFVDTGETPPIEIQQYVGRTTTGRPLTVNVTIREPRTAPTAEQLREFVASIAPA